MRFSNLANVLIAAEDQAENGKGKSRHALGDENFEDQLICILDDKPRPFCNLGRNDVLMIGRGSPII